MIKAGTQFWNEDKTKGYEFTQNYDVRTETLCSHHVAPLGKSYQPSTGEEVPIWFLAQMKGYLIHD